MATNRKACLARENRIMREMMQCQSSENILFTRDVEDIGKWFVRLPRKNGGLPEALVQDMASVSCPGMDFVIDFPDEYPFSPPTIRVAAPRLRKGTGFVISGSLCMELLTVGGWSPALSMEGVMQSVCGILSEGKARLECIAPTPTPVEAAAAEVAAAAAEAADGRDPNALILGAAAENPVDDALAEDAVAVADIAVLPKKQQSRKRALPEQTQKQLEERCTRGYSEAEAVHAWEHIVSFHDKHGWTKKPRSS